LVADDNDDENTSSLEFGPFAPYR